MDDDQQFCLRWNNHQSTLISVFDTLLEKGIHVDCTLAAEGQTLKAHKVVLSACSPYFESVLSQQYDKHPIIILKDVKFAELRAMMDYMYRGEVNISQDQLGALLKAAESLQIKGLSDNKPPPPPPPPQNNTPAAVSPAIKVSGARTLSPGHEEGSREGSASPTRRKRKKRRASLSPVSTPTPLLLNNNPPTPPDTHHDTMAKIKLLQPSEDSLPTPIKPLLPSSSPDTVATLEPKSEVPDDGQDEPVEDLTLDEEAYSEAEHNGAGTSHSLPDVSTQGYSWHMDRSQDDISLSHEGQRDSTDVEETFNKSFTKDQQEMAIIDLDLEASFLNETEYDTAESLSTSTISIDDSKVKGIDLKSDESKDDSINNDLRDSSNIRALPADIENHLKILSKHSDFGNLPCAEYETPDGFKCPNCHRTYNARKNLVRHINLECGREPQYKCPYCSHRNHRRNELKRHIQKKHSNVLPVS